MRRFISEVSHGILRRPEICFFGTNLSIASRILSRKKHQVSSVVFVVKLSWKVLFASLRKSLIPGQSAFLKRNMDLGFFALLFRLKANASNNKVVVVADTRTSGAADDGIWLRSEEEF